MDETRFFEILDEARDGGDATSPSADPERLAGVLGELEDDELEGFDREFDRQIERLNDWRIWGAGFVAAGGMSDDAFIDFRSWIIGKGADAIAQALSDPDGLVEFLSDGDELSNEGLRYVSLELLEERGVEEPLHPSGGGEPMGEPFDETTVEADYPRLAAWAANQG
jgi:hypothetical protein